MPVDFATQLKEQQIEQTRKAVGAGERVPGSFADELRRRKALEAAGEAETGLGAETILGPEQPLGQPLSAVERARLSLLGDTPEERKLTFRQMFPEGALTTEPGTGREIFRRTKTDRFAPVDPSLEEAGATPGLKAAEIGRDIADIAGDVPSMAGEAAGLMATRGFGAATRALGVAAGGGAGEAVRQGLQTAAGSQVDELKEQADRAIGAFAIGAGGGVGGEAIAGLTNLTRRAGLLNVPPEAQAAQRAAARQGQPDLLAIQASDNPIIRQLGQQATMSVPTLRRYVANQERRLEALVRGVSDPKERVRLLERGATEHANASKAVVRGALDQRVELRGGGRNIQQGIRLWEESSAREVDGFFAAARSIEEPRFDLTDLKETARSIKQGVQAATEEGGQIRVSTVAPEVESVADDILSIDPNLPAVTLGDGTVVTGTDQLRALGKRLHDLTLAGPEGKREPQFIAGRLFAALQGTLDSGVGTNPTFAKAWRTARKEAKRRFDTREKLAVIKAAQDETPSQLAARLARPGQIDNLVILRKIVPDDKWKKFQESFKTGLIDPNNKQGVIQTLDSFDQPTLNTLMSKAEQRQWREVGREVDKLNTIGFQQAMDNEQTVVDFMGRLVQRDNPEQVAALASLVKSSGGKDSPFGRSVRASLADQLFDAARRTTPEGRSIIDGRKLEAGMRLLGQRKLLRFLKPAEVRVFNDSRKVAAFVEAQTDTGASLQRASLAAGLLRLSPSAIGTLLRNMTLGRIVTSPAGRLLVGTGAPERKERLLLRLLTLAASDLAMGDEQTEALGNSISQLGQ